MVYYCISTIVQFFILPQAGKGGKMAWQFNQREPVFLQIASRLRGDIIRGEYSPDDQFPSVRQLASVASVNPNTMQKALACLEEEGILYSKGTAGRFVTSDESVLQAAGEKMRRDLVRRIISDANGAGIGADDLINYIKEVAEV